MGTGSNQSNVDVLNNIRHKASRHFRSKMKGHLKAKIDELATNSKTKNITDFCRGISFFKKGYQFIINRVKSENGDLVTDYNIIF